MASDAGCRSSLVLAAQVASRAVECCVHARQSEIRWRPSMIELSAQPGIDGVALFALRRKTGRNVIGSSRLLKRVLMARITLDRESLELANRFALVTVCAIQAGVPANEWKAVVVLLDGLQSDVPALHRMTVLAVRSHLPAMNIGMTVRTASACVGEHRFSVALGATHALVKPAQRILCFVVIKFRNGADRFPPQRGVAVLAGNREAAVRAA